MVAASPRPPLRWSVFGGMAASLLIGLAMAFWPMVAADRALQAFCRDQADGTPLTAVRARAEARGYDTAPVDSTTLRIDDPAGFGRRQCELALDGQARVRQPAQAR